VVGLYIKQFFSWAGGYCIIHLYVGLSAVVRSNDDDEYALCGPIEHRLIRYCK